MKRLISNLMLVFFSILLTMFMLEALLRIFFPVYSPTVERRHEDTNLMEFDSRYGWFHKKDTTVWVETQEYAEKVYLNEKGLRGKSYPYEKKSGVYRIIILGDSFVFGLGVGDEDLFSLKLEELFKRYGKDVEVINMGLNGFGTDQEYLLLEYEGFDYSPDMLIIFFFVGNDIDNNSASLQYGKNKPYFKLEKGALELNNSPVPQSRKINAENSTAIEPKGRINIPFLKNFLQKHSYAYTFLRLRYNYLLHKIGIRSSFDQSAIQKGWGVTEAIFIKTRDACLEHNCDFLVAIIPTREQVMGVESDAIQQKFISFAQNNGIEYLNLLDELKGRADLNFMIDSHWNRKGHGFIADLLFKRLNKHGLSG